MLKLNLSNEPRWLDLAAGVRVQVRPLTTALMFEARRDPVMEGVPEDATEEDLAWFLGRALARHAILAWEGVGDENGEPLEPSPAAIDALLEILPVFEAWVSGYVAQGLLLEQEKNA